MPRLRGGTEHCEGPRRSHVHCRGDFDQKGQSLCGARFFLKWKKTNLQNTQYFP